MNYREKTDSLMNWYSNLSPQSLPLMGEYYADKIYFKDPFHEIHSEDELEKYMGKAFSKLKNSRFVFKESVVEGASAVLVWDFEFQVVGQDFKIHGSSLIKWNQMGKVDYHRDYWDLSEEVWEKIPGFGFVVQVLKKLFS